MLDDLTRALIELRIQKARECLKDAEILLSSVSYAASANRSYYSVFHAIQAVLTTVGFSAKKHSGSIAEFRRVFVKTGVFEEIYSDIIGDAFKVRTKSDYDVHYIISKEDVAVQLKNATDFLTAVEAYLSTL